MPASRAERLAAALLILGAFAVVLAVAPYRSFELDRFFLPKEVVLHAESLGTAGLHVMGSGDGEVGQGIVLWLAAGGN